MFLELCFCFSWWVYWFHLKKNRKGTKEQRTSTECIRFEIQPWSTSTYTLYVHTLYIVEYVSCVYSQVIWSGPGVHHLQKPVNPNLCWVVLCCKNGFMGICQCKHHCRSESALIAVERWRDLLSANWGSRLYSSRYFDNSSIQSSNSLCLDKSTSARSTHTHWNLYFLCRFSSLFICLPGWFPETLTCDFIMQFHKFCSPVLATNYHLVFRLFPCFFRFSYLFIHFIQEEATGSGRRIRMVHGKFINKIWNCTSCIDYSGFGTKEVIKCY